MAGNCHSLLATITYGVVSEPRRAPIRSSVDALSAAAENAEAELGQITDDVRTSMDRIARLTGPAARKFGMPDVEAELRQIGTDMDRVFAGLQEQTATAIAGEADALQSLLRDAVPDPDPASSRPPAGGPPDDTEADNVPAPTDSGVIDTGDNMDKPTDLVGEEHARPATGSDYGIASLDRDVNGAAPGSSTSADAFSPADGRREISNGPISRSSSQRAAEARRIWLANGQEVGDMVHKILVKPNHDPPQPPRGAEVNDPVTAVTISISVLLEATARWAHRRRER